MTCRGSKIPMKIFLLLLLVFGASLTLVDAATLLTFSGRVVGVSDGDTITVLHDGRGEKVRLFGIDCPEGGQDFGKRAKQRTSDLAFGKIVEVRTGGKDRYQRTIGEVILPDQSSLNERLVREGLAWWYRKYAPDEETLKRLELEAKAQGRGLWAYRNPTPPWEFRGARKHASSAPSSEYIVKLSRGRICYPATAKGFQAVRHYVPYKSVAQCLSAGGRLAAE